MNRQLFNNFDKVSTKQWKQKIQVDLKGADYQTLITHTLENIDIKPFYHFDTFDSFKQLSPSSFKIAQELHIYDEKIARKIAHKALQKGAHLFTFRFNQAFDIERVIQGLDFSKLIFKADILDIQFIKKLYHKTKGKSQIWVDPIGHLTATGNWHKNESQDFDKLNQLQTFFPDDYPFILIDATLYKNSGASITQEIAYALSHAVEYLENLNGQTARQIVFNMAVGSHFFFEIVKLKVLRVLWQIVENEYDMQSSPVIYSQPSLRNKTLFDPYVNMLRTTMEMMSAILGGSNMIANLPYDSVYKKSNEFSERIARNQMIILQEESHFDKALNSTDNNYYIETISRQLSDKALQIFKQIEKGGGFLSQLYKGKIQEKIAETAEKEQADFDEGKLVLVGVNKYINMKEKPEKIEIYPFIKKRSGKTLIRPILSKRLSESVEKQRLTELGISF